MSSETTSGTPTSSAPSTQTLTLDALPEELLLLVCEHMTMQSTLRFEATSKQFKAIVDVHLSMVEDLHINVRNRQLREEDLLDQLANFILKRCGKKLERFKITAPLPHESIEDKLFARNNFVQDLARDCPNLMHMLNWPLARQEQYVQSVGVEKNQVVALDVTCGTVGAKHTPRQLELLRMCRRLRLLVCSSLSGLEIDAAHQLLTDDANRLPNFAQLLLQYSFDCFSESPDVLIAQLRDICNVYPSMAIAVCIKSLIGAIETVVANIVQLVKRVPAIATITLRLRWATFAALASSVEVMKKTRCIDINWNTGIEEAAVVAAFATHSMPELRSLEVPLCSALLDQLCEKYPPMLSSITLFGERNAHSTRKEMGDAIVRLVTAHGARITDFAITSEWLLSYDELWTALGTHGSSLRSVCVSCRNIPWKPVASYIQCITAMLVAMPQLSKLTVETGRERQVATALRSLDNSKLKIK